jgi:hypothetical protein
MAATGWAGRIDWPIKGVVFGDFGLVFTNKRGFEEQIVDGRKEFNTKDTKSTRGRTRQEKEIEDF